MNSNCGPASPCFVKPPPINPTIRYSRRPWSSSTTANRTLAPWNCSGPNNVQPSRPKRSQLMFRLAAAFIMFVSTVLDAGSVLAQQRLPTIPPDQYTADQKKAAEEFLATRKVPVFGPFEPMMHSPEVMNMARAMGDYLRYHSAIGNTLSELVVLVTAREWSQDYEWYVHYPIALKAGVAKDIADAIADGRRLKSSR